MGNWSHTFNRIASEIDKQFDVLAFNLKLRQGWLAPLEIQAYRGHGTDQMLYLKGRVLENKGIVKATETDGAWENVVNLYRRFNSAEIPYARLRARFEGIEYEVEADHEGYFDLQFDPQGTLPIERAWHKIDLKLSYPQVEGEEPVRTQGYVLVPPPHAAFGVISDIDDTIILTGATDPLTMARIVVLNNPHTRLPFEGVASFYQALRKGDDGERYNPIFYVSSSPWNLYDLLIDFLNINGIPVGPLFLRDVGLEDDHWIKSGHDEHKLKQIRTILTTHATLPFILIGDSGQEDPEIYREVVREHGADRIKAIYIRDVTAAKRGAAIQAIRNELREQGVAFEFVADSITAARHAAQQGFISPDALPSIEQAKQREQDKPRLRDELIKPITGEE